MLELVPLLLISFFSGIVLSIVGGGFGLIGTPLLIYVVGLQVHDAILISIISTSIICTIYVIRNIKHNLVIWKYALPISFIGLFIAPFGAKISTSLDQHSLTAIYGMLMLLSSFLMWKNSRKPSLESTQKKEAKKHKYPLLLIVAAIASFISGMTGIGGGILIVPLLVLLMDVSMKKATATSIFIIAIFAGAGGMSHFLLNEDSLLQHIATYSTGGIVGTIIGSKIAKTTPDKKLKRAFATVVSIAGLIIVTHNLVA